MSVFYADGSRFMESPYIAIAPQDPAVIDDQDCVEAMRTMIADFQRQMREYISRQTFNDASAFRDIPSTIDNGFTDLLNELADVDDVLVQNAERRA